MSKIRTVLTERRGKREQGAAACGCRCLTVAMTSKTSTRSGPASSRRRSASIWSLGWSSAWRWTGRSAGGLPSNGHLHIDRQLPFLVDYRRPARGVDRV